MSELSEALRKAKEDFSAPAVWSKAPNMTDRELLHRAAKAAGLWDAKNNCIDIPWNPLIDDGDALRLAVKLDLEVRQVHFKSHAGQTGRFWETEDHGTDPCAATRRAIVRAAAAALIERLSPEEWEHQQRLISWSSINNPRY